jgi:hypothetical protein
MLSLRDIRARVLLCIVQDPSNDDVQILCSLNSDSGVFGVSKGPSGVICPCLCGRKPCRTEALTSEVGFRRRLPGQIAGKLHFVHCNGQRRSDPNFLVQDMMLTAARYN